MFPMNPNSLRPPEPMPFMPRVHLDIAAQEELAELAMPYLDNLKRSRRLFIVKARKLIARVAGPGMKIEVLDFTRPQDLEYPVFLLNVRVNGVEDQGIRVGKRAKSNTEVN